ncbi:hypothetical protein D3Z33_15785 [Senegalia massiliensis]|uniref:Uncharacterized protein n=1 Tax=Senegalia massiliensis TaxID=1720316 RepID=A0A845R223_9CLOT|nr:hypothetical protein [Senegalia massiliensis]
MFILLFLRNIKFLKSRYMYKLSTIIKFFILIFINVFNVIILSILYYINTHWLLGILYNSLTIALTIFLTISLFFNKKNKKTNLY